MHPTVAGGLLPTPRDYANAASDVWEPLLHEALDVIRTLIEDSGVVTPNTGARILTLEDNLQ
jgi:hypothetical protein